MSDNSDCYYKCIGQYPECLTVYNQNSLKVNDDKGIYKNLTFWNVKVYLLLGEYL